MKRETAINLLPKLAGAIESSAKISARPGQCRDLETVARELRRIYATLRVDTPQDSK